MFLDYIHRIRGIAIFCIVSGHCIRIFDWSNNQQVRRIYKSAVEDGVVLFVFISGFLFQHFLHKYEYKKYLISKLKNIILPYLFMSVPMIIYLVFVERQGHWAFPGLDEKSYFYQIVWFYIKGKHLAPFWFIPMISIFYLLFPLFVLIDRNSTSYFFIIPIGIIIAALIHRPPAEVSIIQMCIHFLPIYLFGMFTARYREDAFAKIDKNLWWLFMLFLLLYFFELYFYKNVGIIWVKQVFFHGKELIDINLLQKLVLCLLLVNFFRKYAHSFENNIFDKTLKYLADMSFGIYLIHYYFIEAIFRTQRIFHYKIEWGIFYLAFCVVFLTGICVFFLRMSKLILRSKSRYIIGC